MKNSPLTTILVGALALSALASLVLCWLYIGNTREMRSLQAMANQVNYFRQISSALAGDAIEYSKTHPAMNPVLEATVPNFKALTSTNGTKNGAK
jgi:hypothetical protein